jgi:hypothetical protein
MRAIARDRKSSLFAGSDHGGERTAITSQGPTSRSTNAVSEKYAYDEDRQIDACARARRAL